MFIWYHVYIKKIWMKFNKYIYESISDIITNWKCSSEVLLIKDILFLYLIIYMIYCFIWLQRFIHVIYVIVTRWQSVDESKTNRICYAFKWYVDILVSIIIILNFVLDYHHHSWKTSCSFPRNEKSSDE